MKDFRAIVEAYNKIDFSRQQAALATVVRVRGSSYRSPGARMLITDDGHWTGSISGGCLEGDALRKARKVMNDGKPVTVTYDTREESNQNLGIGLGCNGVIDVLIEATGPDLFHNPLNPFRKIVGTEKALALATVFNSASSNGEKFLIDSEGHPLVSFREQELNKLIEPHLIELFKSGSSQSLSLKLHDQDIEIFIELIQPSISLIIFGGGFDARPVSQLAKSLGWNVTVTDECVAHIAPVFFPNADKLSLCDRSFIDRDFKITPYTACVLMSHNYEYDRDVLKSLIKYNTPYIGILGPRKRFDKMLQEFEEQNIKLPEEMFHRIHSPIGLDIGAEAPDEIAVSIIAEIQSKFTDRSGGFLKYRNGPIHQREVEDQIHKQVYLSSTLGDYPMTSR